MSVLVYLLDIVLGPIGLVLNLGELGVAIDEGQRLLSLLSSGELTQSFEAILSGELATSGHLFANGIGTALWAIVAGSLLGEVGEFGEIFEIFG